MVQCVDVLIYSAAQLQLAYLLTYVVKYRKVLSQAKPRSPNRPTVDPVNQHMDSTSRRARAVLPM